MMKKHFLRFSALTALLFSALFFSSSSCQKDPDPVVPGDSDPDYSAKIYLRKEYMDVYYYWYKDVKSRNASLDATQYDIYDFFDAMLYSKDRWSWMENKDSYISSETGVVSGTYGASLSQPVEYYNDYSVKVRYVFPGSPFADQGVTRGWTLTHINGVEVMTLIRNKTYSSEYAKSPQTFTFLDLNGLPKTFTATAATSLSTRSFLEAKVFYPVDFNGLTEPVGYFNYRTFRGTMLDDIRESMAIFKAAGVKKLILDLRYNGGGDSNASQLLVNFLAPASADGEVYVTRMHNDILASNNQTYTISRDGNALDLDALYFIMGHGSASASEMVYNGLKPLMTTKCVGDTTYGKPNGMYVLMYPGSNTDYSNYNKGDYSALKYVFLPICFYNKNKLGESIPDDGFIPDNYRADDMYHDFGVTEDNIKACLTHIATGSFPTLPSKVATSSSSTSRRSGSKINLAEEEVSEHYGSDLVKKH
ncbi:MAG: S41 family peptidase [Bacteroidales bacterium]